MGTQVQHRISDDFILREVKKEDCHDLWVWRNHPDIRKWCSNPNEIPYEQHQVWFENILTKKDVALYILINARGEGIGQVRFDFDVKEEATINVNLNPEYLGQGIGAVLVKKSTGLFLMNHPEIKEIKAEIFEDNIASRAVFEKCGFKFLETMDKNQRKTDVFICQR